MNGLAWGQRPMKDGKTMILTPRKGHSKRRPIYFALAGLYQTDGLFSKGGALCCCICPSRDSEHWGTQIEKVIYLIVVPN
jgi:hypothetical protein